MSYESSPEFRKGFKAALIHLSDKDVSEKDEFLSGFLVAIQYFVIQYKMETGAIWAIRETGISEEEFLKAQKDMEYHDDIMIPLIKEAFK